MAGFRRTAALLLLSAICLQSAAFADDSGITLPEPPSSVQEMILGDSSLESTHEITLYFAGENNASITSSTRSIPVMMNQSLIESALNYLLRSRFSENSPGTAAADVELIDVEFACGIATVNLTIGSSAQLSDQAELLRCTAIANTLLGIEGVEAVNILTGGRSDAICSLPMGVFTQPNEAISTQYAQLQSEREDFLTRGNTALKRSVALYFPSSSGYLLPELRSLKFSDRDYAAVILDALRTGPADGTQCFSPIPDNDGIFFVPPVTRVNESGERILELNFSAMLPNYLAFSGIDSRQFYGSIVLSMCSFMPELDGVRMYVEDAPILSCAIGERTLQFAEGLMRRGDFTSLIGSSAALYFADGEGRLVREICPLSQASAASPKGILTAMVSAVPTEGHYSVFPAEIYADDILGVQLSSGIASVNLSGSFYARCQGLNVEQERNLVYAMVNALCELPEIGAVRFLVEGMAVETLCREIYLKTHLLPDPGLA